MKVRRNDLAIMGIILLVLLTIFGAGGISTGWTAEKPFYFLGLHCLSGNFAGPGEDGDRGCKIALEERT